MNDDYVAVADILPFWRYAVAPHSSVSPGIPYYRYGPAKHFYNETIRQLPWAGVTLYKRTWHGLIVLHEYDPKKSSHDRPLTR